MAEPQAANRDNNWILPRDWMPVDPMVADVAEWGTNPLPVYTSDLGSEAEAEAEERIAAAQQKRLQEVPDVQQDGQLQDQAQQD